MAEELNSNKTSFMDIYSEPTPLPYYKKLTPLGYGSYHDRFVRLLCEHQPNLHRGVKKVVDIGALYGSTSVAFAYGGEWDSTINPDPVSDFDITGVDLSENALQFGLKSGVYSKIIAQDLNDPLCEDFHNAVTNADVLLCMMCLNYFRDGVFASVLRSFAENNGKFAIYGTVPMFDDRCYSPEALGIPFKSSKTAVLRHRSLTEDESKQNGGATESFVRVYIVEF